MFIEDYEKICKNRNDFPEQIWGCRYKNKTLLRRLLPGWYIKTIDIKCASHLSLPAEV